MANISIPSVNQGPRPAKRPKTSSRCVTGSVTATHDFEVANFSLLHGMGIGKYVVSSTFSVGGRDWKIRLYPDGSETEHKDYVSVFLYILTGAVDMRVKFSFRCLLDKCEVLESDTHTFASIGDNRGSFKFIEKTKLRELIIVVYVLPLHTTPGYCLEIVPAKGQGDAACSSVLVFMWMWVIISG
ncbi:hypothetical protein EJB05_39672, partial [Eragrostis curvula]